MQFAGVHTELGDHAHDQFGEHAGAVGVEQFLQRPPGPVVVEPGSVGGAQAEQIRRVRRRPFAQPVQRRPADEQVENDQPDHRVRGQPVAAVRRR